MRWEIVNQFKQLVVPDLPSKPRVAIVGGTANDPEVAVILAARPQTHVTFFGIDSSAGSPFIHMDLNIYPSGESLQSSYGFDLVVNSQVLEHLWDVPTAINNLISLARPCGTLWIACPASNHPHGSPDYYSAGYTADMISTLLRIQGCRVTNAGQIGSRRMYVYTHTFQRWPSRFEHDHPLIPRKLGNGSIPKQLGRYAKYLPQRIMASVF